MTKNSFGSALRSRRQKLEKSLRATVPGAGITEHYLSSMERGQAPPPTAGVIELLAGVLGIQVENLFFFAAKDGYPKAPTIAIEAIAKSPASDIKVFMDLCEAVRDGKTTFAILAATAKESEMLT